MKLNHLILQAARKLANQGKPIKSKKWQGTDLKNSMFETIKVYLGPAEMPENIEELAKETRANLPWAENHFKERISGVPSNPGEEYKNWPFWKGQSDLMMDKGEIFSHTYQERFWPKYAGLGGDRAEESKPHFGIRYEYGDLMDVLNLLAADPDTRQAYLPIFFPEDTGAVHGGRVPCTLGYLFQIRNNHLHVTYYIRSCDYYRHFRDDIYMAVRLVHQIILCLQEFTDKEFSKLKPGLFDMHIGSLHIFNHEVNKLKKELE